MSESSFSCIPGECWEARNISSWYWHSDCCRLLCCWCQDQCFSECQV